MRVLVTGGAGFIGSHVAQALVGRGDEVVIVDNLSDYYDVQLKKDRVAALCEGIAFHHLDIGNFAALKNLFAKSNFDVVCHLAAQAGVRHSLVNPFIYNETNNLGTLNILELMKDFGVKKIVLASSSSVYGGNKKVPFSVIDPVDTPVSLYAATKKHTEHMAHVYHKLYGVNSLCLRFFTVYGPWGRPDMALFKFTKNILEGNPIEVYNYGDHLRDFTYVTDIVKGVLAAIDNVKEYNVLNLGNNNPVQLLDFITLIEKALGKQAEKKMLPMQLGDVHTTYADIDKTKEVLGWQPEIGIEEGINNFVNWYNWYYGGN